MLLQNKIDFALIITACMCNPNGDPLNGNRPRIDLNGYGEISDVCIKRKIRNRLQDMGQKIFIQEDDRINDPFKSLHARANACIPFSQEIKKKKKADIELCKKIACQEWTDVRYFGQVFAFKGSEASISVRGPVSVSFGKSLEPIDIREIMITKSTNVEENDGKDSGTVGFKYIIEKGVYVVYGSVFPQLAEKTGFSQEDAKLLKDALKTLFENDSSAIRPSGTMTSSLYWWEHESRAGSISSGKLFRTLKIVPTDIFPYYITDAEKVNGVTLEIYE